MRPLAYLGGAAALASLVAVPMLENAGARDVAWLVAGVLPFYATGVLAYWKRPDLSIARLLLAAGSLWALATATGTLVALAYERRGEEPWLWAGAVGRFAFTVAAVAATGTLFALFPDARFHRRYERLVVAAMWSVLALPLFVVVGSPTVPLDDGGREVRNPVAVPALASSHLREVAEGLSGVPLFVGLALLVLRYRRSGAEQRRQTRWLLIVPLVGLIGGVLVSLIGLDSGSAALEIAVAVAGYVLLALVPVSIVIAILRHRLLDVDVLLRRSLVYGVLWLLLAAAYIAAAAAFGIAAGERLPVALAVLVAVAAAVVFQPARQRLERLVDRSLFGERLSGYELLTRFGATLEQTFDPAELLSRLAETVRRGLNVRWARVSLHGAGGESCVLDSIASAGPDPHELEPAASVQLAYGGERLGLIECGPRLDGALRDDDREVLEHLARQAALAIHNARLAAELAGRLAEIRRQADELSASRARLVQVQDAERRRIERNIHDGVQQELVALIAKLRLARNQLGRDPAHAAATLAEVQAEAGVVLADVRELAQGIHPSVLSDRGLVEAIEARAARLPLDVRINADPSVRECRFDDEIEGAAYFLVSESLANALKHASAGRVVVRLKQDDHRLLVEVADDGAGFETALIERRGLAHLADRLDALGGRLSVLSRPEAGTRVVGELPGHARETARA